MGRTQAIFDFLLCFLFGRLKSSRISGDFSFVPDPPVSPSHSVGPAKLRPPAARAGPTRPQGETNRPKTTKKQKIRPHVLVRLARPSDGEGSATCGERRPRREAWRLTSVNLNYADLRPLFCNFGVILQKKYTKIGRAQQMRGLRPRQSWGRCPQTPARGAPPPWTPRYRFQFFKFFFQ